MVEALKNKGLVPKFVSYFVKRTGKVKQFKIPGDMTGAGVILFIDSGELSDLLFYSPLVNYFHERFPDMKSVILAEESHIPVETPPTGFGRISISGKSSGPR